MFAGFFNRYTIRLSALAIALIAIGLVFNAIAAWRDAKDFALAEAFPRGALVYAQFADLPAMLSAWDGSDLKSRYIASTNYQQLQTRRLALKLVDRWKEFNDAAGFPIDADVLATLADNRAALAVYDIGKLDLVLIAPVSEAKIAASRFLANKKSFEQRSSAEGQAYYLHDVEADSGRRKQQIGFAFHGGKFILATRESLLLRALANGSGQAAKDRLSDEPAFQSLAAATSPHFATIWVDQAKLNDDWYFKKYWMMSRVADLKQMRAGMFDLEMRDDKWIEHRQFLGEAGKLKAEPAMVAAGRQQIAAILPGDLSFVRLRAADGGAAALVADALFDAKKFEARDQSPDDWYDSVDSDFSAPEGSEEEDTERYAYLSHTYNQYVDDPDDAREKQITAATSSPQTDPEAKTRAALAAILRLAQPAVEAKVARPRPLEGPLFADFGRAAILSLAAPAALNRTAFEQTIAQLAAQRLMIAGAAPSFVWKEQRADGATWRTMELPALGRSLSYGVRGSLLIVSASPELLAELMTKSNPAGDLAGPAPLRELTVIRLSQRAAAFDAIVTKLDAPRVRAYWKERKGDAAGPNDPSQEFFSGNIASLLDVASPVSEVRIERGFLNGRLKEDVEFRLKR